MRFMVGRCGWDSCTDLSGVPFCFCRTERDVKCTRGEDARGSTHGRESTEGHRTGIVRVLVNTMLWLSFVLATVTI